MPLSLLPAHDDHFAWMLGERDLEGLLLPAGAVDESAALRLIRSIAARARSAGRDACWMIVIDDEVVGLCGLKHPPTSDGLAEIGYNIFRDRRNLGYASQAISALIELSANELGVRCLTAETGIDNIASQRVLLRNDFVRTGMRKDSKDGELICWERLLALRPSKR